MEEQLMKEEPNSTRRNNTLTNTRIKGHSPFSHQLQCSSAHVSLSGGESVHQNGDGTPKIPNDRDNLEEGGEPNDRSVTKEGRVRF